MQAVLHQSALCYSHSLGKVGLTGWFSGLKEVVVGVRVFLKL